MQWLEEDFLLYLDNWEASVNTCTDVPQEQKKKLLLSAETIEGLRITGMQIRYTYIVLKVDSMMSILYSSTFLCGDDEISAFQW